MLKPTHKIIISLISVFFLGMILLPLFFEPASAADPYVLKQPIGNVESLNFDGSTRPIAEYIQGIYKYSIGIVAILATVVMMIGGLVWMTAAGSQTRISEAKQYITGALTGMVLVLCSYMILNTINPDLVNIKPVKIGDIDKIDSLSGYYNTGNATKDPDSYLCSEKICESKDCKYVLAEYDYYDVYCRIIKQCSWYITCPGIDGEYYTEGSESDCKIEDKTNSNLKCCCLITQ